MNTPQTQTKSSACFLEMMPSATASVTALATAAWAGPNICTACFAPLIVTLVIITVAGLASRLGVSTASKFEWPSLWRAKALANAWPTGPSLSPINRSIWAISFPSPARASPMYMLMHPLLKLSSSVDRKSLAPRPALDFVARRYPTGGVTRFGRLQQIAGQNAKNITPRLHCKGAAVGQPQRSRTSGRILESFGHLWPLRPLGFLDKSVKLWNNEE